MSREWLDELQEKVSNCWEWHSPAMQVMFRYVKPEPTDDFWEVWAYPAVQEIVGGKEDGETVWSGFNFDVLGFLNDFEPSRPAIWPDLEMALDTLPVDDPVFLLALHGGEGEDGTVQRMMEARGIPFSASPRSPREPFPVS